MAWRRLPISAFLRKSEDWVHPEPDRVYQQIRVHLWGNGLTLRAKVAGANIAARRQLRASAGQFLISRIDARHGASGIVPDHLDGALVSNDFPCFEIDERVVLPRYLEWYSRTDQFVELCRRASEGSTNRVRLKEARFMENAVFLPSLGEQQEAIRKLDKLRSLIEVASELGSEADRDARAFVESVHFDSAEPRVRKLGDFLELWEDRVSVDPRRSYPQVGIHGFVGGLFFKGAVLGSETAYRSFNRLSSGLLVVSQPKGWEGAVAVCTSEHDGWFVSPEYRTFRCRRNLLDERYLEALLATRWFQDLLARLVRGQGARRQRLRPEMLLDIGVQMPSNLQQRASLQWFDALRRIQGVRSDTDQQMHVMLRAVVHKTLKSENSSENRAHVAEKNEQYGCKQQFVGS